MRSRSRGSRRSRRPVGEEEAVGEGGRGDAEGGEEGEEEEDGDGGEAAEHADGTDDDGGGWTAGQEPVAEVYEVKLIAVCPSLSLKCVFYNAKLIPAAFSIPSEE